MCMYSSAWINVCVWMYMCVWCVIKCVRIACLVDRWVGQRNKINDTGHRSFTASAPQCSTQNTSEVLAGCEYRSHHRAIVVAGERGSCCTYSFSCEYLFSIWIQYSHMIQNQPTTPNIHHKYARKCIHVQLFFWCSPNCSRIQNTVDVSITTTKFPIAFTFLLLPSSSPHTHTHTHTHTHLVQCLGWGCSALSSLKHPGS